MPGSYKPSTIESIGDIKNGVFVESSELEYDVWGEKVQRYIFEVNNRVIIHALFAEVTETISGAVQTCSTTFKTHHQSRWQPCQRCMRLFTLASLVPESPISVVRLQRQQLRYRRVPFLISQALYQPSWELRRLQA